VGRKDHSSTGKRKGELVSTLASLSIEIKELEIKTNLIFW
jgi:hypothetical protein